MVILDAGADLEFVDFPIDSVISLTAQDSEGQTIEVSMVGPEGVLGTWAAGGVDWSPWLAISQVGGDVWRYPVQEFREVLRQAPTLWTLVDQYALMQTFLMSQSVLCNRFHDLPQRAARWLLILRSKSGADPLPMTQEFLSQMLGVHRPSVTLALQGLAEQGLIRAEGRGLITIIAPNALEAIACECYGQVQAFNQAIAGEGPFPPHPRHGTSS